MAGSRAAPAVAGQGRHRHARPHRREHLYRRHDHQRRDAATRQQHRRRLDPGQISSTTASSPCAHRYLSVLRAISGAGALQQNGSGKTILTAASTYTGPTTVNAATLIVNGSLASGVTVNGGLFGGSGQVASLTLNGGALSPGNSIGTMTIIGNLVMASAAAYLVEVSTTSADMTKVGGSAKLAGTLAFFPVSGVYTVGTQYVLLNAAGGVSGTFTTATSPASSAVRSNPWSRTTRTTCSSRWRRTRFRSSRPD